MPKGTCKLCLEDKELCDSHYLPKRLYAFARARQMKNPNPLVVSGKSAKQVSDQLRGYVFCKGCEDLFNKNGEAWVLAKIPHDYGEPFPLQDALVPEKPLAIGKDVNLYDGSSIKAFDMEKLVYFGLSIFWRGAARRTIGNQRLGLALRRLTFRITLNRSAYSCGGRVRFRRMWCYRSTCGHIRRSARWHIRSILYVRPAVSATGFMFRGSSSCFTSERVCRKEPDKDQLTGRKRSSVLI